jgi:aryl-alcohol dehydrogenase-like predicted oxidoreductase
MSLPVTTAVVGMPHVEMLEHNIAMARSFSALKEDEMERLRHVLSPSREDLENRLVGHLDGPTTTPHAFFA